MYELKKNVGRVTVNCLGIVLNKDSTQEQIAAAIQRKPAILKFFDNLKTEKNDKTKK